MPYIDGPISINVRPGNQNITFDRSTLTLPSILDLLVNTISNTAAVSVSWYIQFEGTSVEWLNSAGATTGYLDYPDQTGSLSLTVANLDQLFGTTYRANIHFIARDVNDNIFEVVSSINLSISGDSSTATKTDFKNYNVVYRRLTNTFSGNTVVNILNNTTPETLSLDTIGTLLKESTFTTTFNLQEDPAFPFATNSELPTSGTKVVSCRLKKAGVFIYAFTVTITVLESDDLIATPNSFNFNLRNGFNETQTGVLKIINPLAKTYAVTYPAFLTGSSSSGSSNADITLTTANSDTFAAGVYTGNIVVNYDSKTITIPVTLTVLVFATLGTKSYNFCLDQIFINANRMTATGKYLQISLAMNFTSTSGSENINSVYAIPYFNDKVKTDIGEKIQNFYPRFAKSLFGISTVDFNNTFVYKPAKVTIKVDEVDTNYAVMSSKTFTNILFFAGHEPKLFPLFTNYDLRRKFAGSPHIFSYFTGLLAPEDFTTGTPTQNTIIANAVEAVFLPETGFSESEVLTKTALELIEFPEVEEQVFVQWLNNNLVPEIAVFSGNYKISDDFEQNFDRFQFGGKKYNSKDFESIIINTGFILQEEAEMIKELIKSPLCFMKIKDTVYECFCTTTKLIPYDRTVKQIAFDLDFLIVKN